MRIFEYINKVIEDNGINYVLAVIKEEKIGDYNLGSEDYTLDNKYKRVDINLMNEKLKFGLNSNQIEEIKKIIKYKSINLSAFNWNSPNYSYIIDLGATNKSEKLIIKI